jgi:hypothetical protein
MASNCPHQTGDGGLRARQLCTFRHTRRFPGKSKDLAVSTPIPTGPPPAA